MTNVDGLDDQTRITQPDAARLLGDVSMMTLWRWRNDPEMNFPRSVEINGRHYYVRSEILKWRPPAKKTPAKKAPSRRNA